MVVVVVVVVVVVLLLFLFPQNTQRKKIENPCFPVLFAPLSFSLFFSFSFVLSFVPFFPLFPGLPSFLPFLSLFPFFSLPSLLLPFFVSSFPLVLLVLRSCCCCCSYKGFIHCCYCYAYFFVDVIHLVVWPNCS